MTTAQQPQTRVDQSQQLLLTGHVKSWIDPVEPFHIVGPVYFVGTRGLAAYLITTPDGHILLDGGVARSVATFNESIVKLGFKTEAIRFLLLTHANVDHEGERAAPYFPPLIADRVLRDGDSVSLGGVRMVARLGGGGLPGATTWTTTVQDGGRAYKVVFPCCAGVNPGCRTVVNSAYPRIADDYRRTFQMLQSLHPDIWLPAHTQSFGFEEKRRRAVKEGVPAWVDHEGYRRWLANESATFEKLLAKAGPAAPRRR